MSDSDTHTTADLFCGHCGYPLAGLADNLCPECGKRYDPLDAATVERRRRICRGCKYPLEGITAGACPECGLAFDTNDPDLSVRAARRSRWPARLFVALAFYPIAFYVLQYVCVALACLVAAVMRIRYVILSPRVVPGAEAVVSALESVVYTSPLGFLLTWALYFLTARRLGTRNALLLFGVSAAGVLVIFVQVAAPPWGLANWLFH
jgi:predicted RNA-binding Zn-ribbon protein involved in translation (DUF1610 family)